ncbi:glycosyltransferase, partial [candidate division KSB1 bacterium]|nr:glycosyltransferase [candidate division KSB1 bacterium]NIS27122.1 glycosyltransferase [candidate division KSB1 bacterium]NIT74008.1 glycosyltransferase [candidate division KSB1 bacterium]NIU90978.1 glycosyltransferase [candidate division KSB1 bacterium]NIW72283.1 glycosyltransferase [candidate division KSB1 bacterium]
MQKRGPLVEQVHENVELVDLSCKRIAQSIPRLAHYMRKERPKAIIATSEHANVALVLARMMSFTRTNVILRIGIAFSVVFGRYKKRRDKLIATLAPVLYRRADKIVCVSEGIAEDFARETGIARDRLIVIHNPKDIEHIRTRAKEKVTHPWFAQKTFPVVLGVGRLRGQKDFATLIEAVALARKDISDLHLIILGEGEEHDALIKLAEKEGVADAVDLPGF